MIEYHEELPILSTGNLLNLHEACITIKSNTQHDSTFEQMDIKDAISILLTEKEAAALIDWYICTQMRSTFIRLWDDRSYEHIDRRITNISLYLVEGTEKYLLEVTWRQVPFPKDVDFVICNSCGDPYDKDAVDIVDGKYICWCCKAGR